MRTFLFIKNQFILSRLLMNQHYLDRYIKFILNLTEVRKDSYGESHHILPKSLFPEFKQKRKYGWNQIRISARAHYICHWLLWKALPNNYQMAEAFAFMQIHNTSHQGRLHFNSKIIAKAKMQANLDKSIQMKEKFKNKNNHPRTGQRLSAVQIRNLSVSHMGHTHSKETKEKMSKSKIGMTYDMVTCPFCNKTGKSSGIKSWHFDYCKLNPNRKTRA